jgi:arsenate reductase
MSLKILHNPRCSKSRKTLELLRERGLEPEIVRYLETPPSAEELQHILQLLGRPPRELLRRGEAEYRELGLADPAIDDATLMRAMVEHPKLIERPIVIAGDRAAIGRPPEAVLEILQNR